MPKGVYKRVKPVWNKGKKGYFTKDAISRISSAQRGKKLSKETKSLIKKNNVKYWKGKKFTKNHKNKLSKSHIGQVPWNKGKPHIAIRGENNPAKRLEVREKLRESAINMLCLGRIGNKRTGIELTMRKMLKELNIEFVEQKRYKLGIADFYLPKHLTFIFCDGDYWHNRPEVKERDIRQNEFLQIQKVNVLRFWEHDIVNNPEIVKKKITKGIHPF